MQTSTETDNHRRGVDRAGGNRCGDGCAIITGAASQRSKAGIESFRKSICGCGIGNRQSRSSKGTADVEIAKIDRRADRAGGGQTIDGSVNGDGLSAQRCRSSATGSTAIRIKANGNGSRYIPGRGSMRVATETYGHACVVVAAAG